MLFELGFKFFKERDGVGGAAGKTGDDFIAVHPPHFAGAALDDMVFDRNLPIACNGSTPIAANGANSGGVKGGVETQN